MKRAVFDGTFPSIMLTSLVQKRYLPRFIFVCLAVAGRPRYSMTSEPLGMRSWVKRPLPLCDRRTVSRKGAGILGHTDILTTAALTLRSAKLLEHGPAAPWAITADQIWPKPPREPGYEHSGSDGRPCRTD